MTTTITYDTSETKKLLTPLTRGVEGEIKEGAYILVGGDFIFFVEEDNPVNPVCATNVTTRIDIHTDTHTTATELLQQLEEDCPTTIHIRIDQTGTHVVIDEHYKHPKDPYSSLYFLTTFPIAEMKAVQ